MNVAKKIMLGLLVGASLVGVKTYASELEPKDKMLLSKIKEFDLTSATALLQDGAEVNACDDDGRTALHLTIATLAGAEGEEKFIDLLLSLGADTSIEDNAGDTPSDLLSLRDDLYSSGDYCATEGQSVSANAAIGSYMRGFLRKIGKRIKKEQK